jgi:signal transduction histidine kinase
VKRIGAILDDARYDRKAKIEKLRQLEADAMAKQRASTEGMAPPDPEEGDDIKAIEKALKDLGENAADTGPASL